MNEKARQVLAAAVVLGVFALSGCGKSVSGDYVDPAGKELSLLSGGNWVMSNGMAGTYKVDGDVLILSGLPGGASISGQIEGDSSIALRDRNLMTGKVEVVRFTRGKAAAAAIAVPSPISDTNAVLDKLPPCGRIDVSQESPDSDKDVIRRLIFDIDTIYGRNSGSPAPNRNLAGTAEKLLKAAASIDDAILPGVKPSQQSWSSSVRCQAWPDPREVFCVSEGFAPNVFQTVTVLRSGANGWNCSTYPVSLQTFEKFMGASPSQKDEALSAKDLQQLSRSNPYYVWGTKNRCKWDLTFAVTDSSCKRL